MYRKKEYRLMQEKKHKIKAKRYFDWAYWREIDDRLIGIRARTRQQCSCWSCGNQRRAEGKTRQEMEADDKMMDEIEDVYEYGYEEAYWK
jgi:hypothetical protein